METGESADGSVYEEVKRWLDRLLAAAGAEQAHAAAEVARLGVWSRRSVRTRGSLVRPAANRLPRPEALDDVIAALRDADPATRCQVAAALGEWGGGDAAVALKDLLRSESHETVVFYGITALTTIGGPAAVEGLRWVIQQGTERSRDAAISGLEELMADGNAEHTDAAPASPPPATGPTRGPIGLTRTRGGVRQSDRQGGSEGGGEAVTDTLRRIRDSESRSPYLRVRAGDVLQRFTG